MQHQVYKRDRHPNGDLRPTRPRRRARIGEHEEGEQEERRSGQRAEEEHLRRKVRPHDPGAETSLKNVRDEKRRDQPSATNSKHKPCEGERDDERRDRERSAPLVRRRRADQVAGEQQRKDNAE